MKTKDIPDDLVNLIKRHEGCRLAAYRDTRGFLTIGYGHRLRDFDTFYERGVRISVSQEEAERMLRRDLAEAVRCFEALFHSVEICEARRAALVSMIYQLGCMGFKGFHKTLSHIYLYDWPEAAAECLQSAWARQTPERAREVAEILRTGQWPEDFEKAA